MLRAFTVAFFQTVYKSFTSRGLIDTLLYSCQLEGSFYNYL